MTGREAVQRAVAALGEAEQHARVDAAAAHAFAHIADKWRRLAETLDEHRDLQSLVGVLGKDM